jgi:hypothetical protein
MKPLPDSFLSALDALAISYLAESDPIRQSGFGGGGERWRAEREPILEGVNASGTFVDLGCANGYLLQSLMAWAHDRSLSLIPYGIDYSAGLVELSRRRLPEFRSHFEVANAWTWRPPIRFQFVYTLYDAVPEDYLPVYLRRLLDEVVAPGGRLIVGAYGSKSRGLAPFDVAGFLLNLRLPIIGRATNGDPPIANFAWVEQPHST